MKQHRHDRSDTRVLLAVAGFVLAGAGAIALLAGLSGRFETTEPAFDEQVRRIAPTPTQPIQAEPATTMSRIESPVIAAVHVASPEDSSEPEFEPMDVPLPPSRIQIDPEADPVDAGLEAYRGRDWPIAAAYFEKAVDDRPDRPWILYMCGLSQWKAGRPDEASDTMRRSAELAPDDIKSWINLSRIENDRGEFESALEAADRAVEIDAEDPTASFLRARSLRNAGRADEALIAVEHSLTGDPENAWARNLFGLMLLDLQRYEEAERELRQAVGLDPDVALFRNNLGMALEHRGELPQALGEYRAATEIDPGHEKAAANLARLEDRDVIGPAGVEEADAEPTEIPEPVIADAGALSSGGGVE